MANKPIPLTLLQGRGTATKHRHGDAADQVQNGGMVASDWTMQCLADFLAAPVDRPQVLETTALGAAYLAGMKSGFYPGLDEFAAAWRLERRFEPNMSESDREAKYAGWKDAIARTMTP